MRGVWGWVLVLAATAWIGCTGSIQGDLMDDDAGDDDAGDDDTGGDDDVSDDDGGDDDVSDDDGGDDDGGDDDVSDDDGGDDDVSDDDVSDDDVSDDDVSDDDVSDDDTGDDDTGPTDPNLLCGPDPDLSAATPPYRISTGFADVQVDAFWPDHWYWVGCHTTFMVQTTGSVHCGVRYEMEGYSSWEDTVNSAYGMDLDFTVVYDTCGNGSGYSMEYSVEDVSGYWDLFEIHFANPYSGAWELLDPDAPGEISWNPQGTGGVGWIEYQSFPN